MTPTKVKTKNICASNVVKKAQLRQVQKETLSRLKDALLPSAGPFGSTTQIVKADPNNRNIVTVTQYSKDGHTILKNIKFNMAIEDSIQRELTDVTRYIKKTVGDGSTSTIVLASLIFDSLLEIEEEKFPPYIIIQKFQSIVKALQEYIKAQSKELTLDDVRKIAMICTNNNEEVSDVIYQIYKEHGMSVFIDVGVSTNENNIIKSYDGLTVEVGYASPVYINTMPANETKKGQEESDAGSSIIRNARVYAFTDPIDTMEMHQFFNAIILKNIMIPYNNMATGKKENNRMIPTVILCPKFSLDLGESFSEIEKFMYQFNQDLSQKPPLLIVSNLGGINFEAYSDIWSLCGCKPIKKYIDPQIQAKDVEEGKAPTLDTIVDFYGECEEVVANGYKTTFINPKGMFAIDDEGKFILDADGNRTFSQGYQTQLAFLEQQLKVAIADGQEIDVIGNLKRRINSLKANMVDYYVGGITPTDRDATRVLVEDAVRNIRSAASNGYGYGTNYEGLRAINKFMNDITAGVNKEERDEVTNIIAKAIFDAYVNMSRTLYSTVYYEGIEDKEAYVEDLITSSLDSNNGPMNFVTKEFDGNVLCTIDQDIAILEVLAKIITIMYTTNQTLTQTPQHNMYIDMDDYDL